MTQTAAHRFQHRHLQSSLLSEAPQRKGGISPVVMRHFVQAVEERNVNQRAAPRKAMRVPSLPQEVGARHMLFATYPIERWCRTSSRRTAARHQVDLGIDMQA